MKSIAMKIRGVDVSIDYENRKIWFDDEVPQEMVNLIGKYMIDEGFINPKKDTDFFNEWLDKVISLCYIKVVLWDK